MSERSKGIALSIRTLIILALALIVLIAIVSIFTGIVPIGGSQMSCEAKLRSACFNYTRHNCCEDGENICTNIDNSVKCGNVDDACCPSSGSS